MKTAFTAAVLGLVATFGFCLLMKRGMQMPSAISLAHFGAAMVVAAAAYYIVDAVGRRPLRAAGEILFNGLLPWLAVFGMLAGFQAMRTAALVGLAAHGIWDLLHVLPLLSKPRHEWLPLGCLIYDWGLAAAILIAGGWELGIGV